MRGLKYYLIRHCQAAIHSIGQLSRAPLASLMTCFVIGVTLALPTSLFIGLKNLQNLNTHLQNTLQITLYLKQGIKEKDVTKLMHTLQLQSAITSIDAISPEQGLKELQKQVGFQGEFLGLARNPIPWTIIILPKSPNDFESLNSFFHTFPQIDSIEYDKIWLKRLASLTLLAQRFIWVLSLFLSLTVFLIIHNTIRNASQHNRKEIEIIKLVGGTPSFIRRPFLYAGILYGLLGGIIAWLLVDTLFLLIKNPLTQFLSLYDNITPLNIGLTNTLILLGSSSILGLWAAWITITKYLKSC